MAVFKSEKASSEMDERKVKELEDLRGVAEELVALLVPRVFVTFGTRTIPVRHWQREGEIGLVTQEPPLLGSFVYKDVVENECAFWVEPEDVVYWCKKGMRFKDFNNEVYEGLYTWLNEALEHEYGSNCHDD